MYKTFKTDSERNAVFTHMANATNMPDNIKYIDGYLCKDTTVVTDKLFLARMEIMFDSMEKLSQLNEVA
jgi:hypothetical protein